MGGEPGVTHTFTDGASNIIYADEVNQNFTDIVNCINSASTYDLGCGSLKVDDVPFASAVVSALTDQDIELSNISCVGLSIGGESISTYIASGAITAIDYESGSFTMAASGITTGADAGTTMTTSVQYVKIGDQVTLYIPAHDGEGYGTPIYEMNGFPADLTPSSTMTINMPGYAAAGGQEFASSIVGTFGYSSLSGLWVHGNGDASWGDGTSATVGYNFGIVVTYVLP